MIFGLYQSKPGKKGNVSLHFSPGKGKFFVTILSEQVCHPAMVSLVALLGTEILRTREFCSNSLFFFQQDVIWGTFWSPCRFLIQGVVYRKIHMIIMLIYDT